MLKRPYPTQEQLKSIVKYDPLTGVFTWKVRTYDMFSHGGNQGQRGSCKVFNTKFSGKKAGKFDKNGYLQIRTYQTGTMCLAHRLAWLYVYGEIPYVIDHVNGDKSDNRIVNLRNVNPSANNKNPQSLHPLNKSGVNGVNFHKTYKKWRARIVNNYQQISLGMHVELKDAVMARYNAEKEYGFTEYNPESSAYKYLKQNNLLQ